MSEMNQPILATAEEAAKMLRMGRSTFWKAVKEQLLPQPVKIGGLTRWRVADLKTLQVPDVLEQLQRRVHKPERRPRRVALGPGVTHLYRHFDREGRLLYIGISLSAIGRLGEHKGASHWFWQIARIEVDAYADRESAARAERISIRREKPMHNIVHAA